MQFKRQQLLLLVFCFLVGGLLFYYFGRAFWVPVVQQVVGKRTVEQVVEDYGVAAEQRLTPYFEQAGVSYPPQQVVLLAMKQEKVLELWVKDGNKPVLIRRYDIQKTSGVSGPKLREGDGQVPEGFYKIIGLNPNSAYHLSMKLNYPNAFDWQQAKNEHRSEPGSNIFIHGKAVSVGCLAMGDEVIEELFVLAAKVGVEHFEVVIAPHDPRQSALSVGQEMPSWLAPLYQEIAAAFDGYRMAK